MEADKLQEHILKNYDSSKRQIVFWYGVDEENEQKLLSLDLGDIKIHKLTKNNNLLTKKLLEHDDLTSNYLVYADFEKSEPKENWFLDTLFYSREFSVDEVANLCSEFDIYDIAVKNLFKEHLKFFNNRDRVNKLKLILPSSKTSIDFYIGMLAVLVKDKLFDFNRVVQRFIIETLLKENDLNKEFAKYKLADKFWEMVEKQFGYKGKRDAKLLLASIIFRKLKQQLSGANFPETYKKYTCANTSEVECNLFLESWYRDTELMPYYKEIAKIIEDKFYIKDNIADWTDIIKQDPEFTTLEIFDKELIKYLINQFDSLTIEDKKVIDKRKNTIFYLDYQPIYSSIYWAIELNNLIKTTNIPEQNAEDFIRNYANEYFKIDKAYRKFYYFCNIANDRALDSVKEKVEKAYVNNYLDNLCSKFSRPIAELQPTWNFSRYNMQQDFYRNEIKNNKVKTVVIISDAFRYEIADELMAEIKNNYSIKADTKLEYMISSIPSYTKLGMAALLPHKEIIMNEKAEVFIDGISTKNSESREKILRTEQAKSKVLNFKDFNDLSRDELREIFNGLEVCYVYHDAIDSAGEHSEDTVFDAVQKSISEIQEKIKFIFNNSLAGNVIVTADHGFLYQYSDLEERQRITIGLPNSLEKSKRYVLSEDGIEIQGVMNFDMKYILKDSKLKASLPQNINRFKTSGSGIKYVHGGASLQEIVIPVLKIKQNKKQEIRKVDLVLENTSRKITNNKFTLSFMQKDSISETIMPRTFVVSLWDVEDNIQVSNELIIEANVNSDIIDDRIFKRVLELKNFTPKKKDYYLYIKDVDEVGEPYQKVAFTVNLVFSTDFDL
ncbi:MAG: BREX-1 system phosphatase PglZ type A [Candidatus Gastranaerophilaceae bacterium]